MAVLPKPIADIDLFQLSIDFLLGIACFVHDTTLFYSAFSLTCTPVAHRDAHGRGSSRCISWYQIQLILTMCYVLRHTALGTIVALDSFDP